MEVGHCFNGPGVRIGQVLRIQVDGCADEISLDITFPVHAGGSLRRSRQVAREYLETSEPVRFMDAQAL